MSEDLSWEAELLRHHRRNSLRIGWRDCAVALGIFAFLLWSLT